MIFCTIVLVIMFALLLRTQLSQFFMIRSGTSVFDANREPCDFHGNFSTPPFCHDRSNNVQLYVCVHIAVISPKLVTSKGAVLDGSCFVCHKGCMSRSKCHTPSLNRIPYRPPISYCPFSGSRHFTHLEHTDCAWTLYWKFVSRARKENISVAQEYLDKLTVQRAPKIEQRPVFSRATRYINTRSSVSVILSVTTGL